MVCTVVCVLHIIVVVAWVMRWCLSHGDHYYVCIGKALIVCRIVGYYFDIPGTIIPTANARNNFNEENNHQMFIYNCVTMALSKVFLRYMKSRFI